MNSHQLAVPRRTTHRCAPYTLAANNPFRIKFLHIARLQPPWNHILMQNRGRGGASSQIHRSRNRAAGRGIGTSVLASLDPLSGTDMPLLLANRSFNMTCTRELRARGFVLVAAPKVD
jgi:hypothetical protein